MKTEKIRQRYLLFLYVFLGFAIGLFCWATYAYYQSSVPSTISIKAGTSEEINLRIPASGILSTDSDTVLALNQPLTIVAGETTNSYQMRLKLFGLLPLKDVDIQVIENTTLTPVAPDWYLCKNAGRPCSGHWQFRGRRRR